MIRTLAARWQRLRLVLADRLDPDRARRLRAQQAAYRAVLSDLADARSEIKHVKAIARGLEDRAQSADARAREYELMHVGQLLSKWSSFTPKTQYTRKRS